MKLDLIKGMGVLFIHIPCTNAGNAIRKWKIMLCSTYTWTLTMICTNASNVITNLKIMVC